MVVLSVPVFCSCVLALVCSFGAFVLFWHLFFGVFQFFLCVCVFVFVVVCHLFFVSMICFARFDFAVFILHRCFMFGVVFAFLFFCYVVFLFCFVFFFRFLVHGARIACLILSVHKKCNDDRVFIRAMNRCMPCAFVCLRSAFVYIGLGACVRTIHSAIFVFIKMSLLFHITFI